MRSRRYGADVLADYGPRPRPAQLPRVAAERGLVVEDSAGQFCGAVIYCEKDAVTLEDRHRKQRVFPLSAPFLLEGKPVMLVRPARRPRPAGPDGQPGGPRRARSPLRSAGPGSRG